MAGSCEHGNESSGSINWENFFTIWKSIRFSRHLCYVEIAGYWWLI